MEKIKLISLALGVLMLFENIGIGIIYQVSSLIHKELMKEKLEKELCLETLTLSISQFNSYKINRKELIIDGKYFDIKSVSKTGELAIVKGIWDEEEIQLKNQVNFDVNSNYAEKTLSLFPIWFTPCTLVVPDIFTTSKFTLSLKSNYITLDRISYLFIFKLVKPPIY